MIGAVRIAKPMIGADRIARICKDSGADRISGYRIALLERALLETEYSWRG